MYHGVTKESEFPGLLNHSGMQLSASRFAKQMELLRNKYNVIRLLELVDIIKNGRPIPRYSVAITFDDGYENNYTQAFPVLKSYQLPATLFVSTHYIGETDMFWPDRLEAFFNFDECFAKISSSIDKVITSCGARRERLESVIDYFKKIPEEQKELLIDELEKMCNFDRSHLSSDYRCLTWDQIREMHSSGLVDVGSHTHNHVIMTRLSPNRAREEVSLSKQLLKEHLGIETKLFSYPNGKIDDYNEKTHQILQEQGFDCALSTVEGFNGQNSPLYELRRIGVHNSYSLVEFESILTGFHSFALRLLKS
jgi:peptidoglycan/xylan/chitin deacetylase (PgdA/CDA1 family)